MTATLRNGEVLNMGDEVTTHFHKTCEGKTFVICDMQPYPHCESGVIVLVHLKDDPERKIEGFKKEGYNDDKPSGIDANWFVPVKK